MYFCPEVSRLFLDSYGIFGIISRGESPHLIRVNNTPASYSSFTGSFGMHVRFWEYGSSGTWYVGCFVLSSPYGCRCVSPILRLLCYGWSWISLCLNYWLMAVVSAAGSEESTVGVTPLLEVDISDLKRSITFQHMVFSNEALWQASLVSFRLLKNREVSSQIMALRSVVALIWHSRWH